MFQQDWQCCQAPQWLCWPSRHTAYRYWNVQICDLFYLSANFSQLMIFKNSLIYIIYNIVKIHKWAATWQNQQNGCAPSEVSDQPGHPPSLIRVFAVRMKEPWVLSFPLSAQWRLWSDWADTQADLSLRWAHTHSAGFVMLRLKCRMKFKTTILISDFVIEHLNCSMTKPTK